MNYVTILHDTGTTTKYAHLKQHGCVVKVGDKVKASQLIADSGDTGGSFIPHLHLQVDALMREENDCLMIKSVPINFIDITGKAFKPVELTYINNE